MLLSADLYKLIRSQRRSLATGRRRIRISGFIRFPSTLAVYGLAHSLPLGGVDRDFPFTEMRSEGIYQTSLVLVDSTLKLQALNYCVGTIVHSNN